MAGKLSFSIAINLLTENFKKGTNSVKNNLRSMQAQILTFAAAMGFAGVSLSNFFSQLIQVARETSKAVTALKNVSGSTAQFADNLRFTTQLAQKYGVYVNDLTGNFAKFTAAANIAGISMDDQRKLFESLSRAASGFGLSADDTNGMFLAITQMMGKGKIQAEELRGQLGERLPIAMQAMAKAASTTVAGLDSIMKKGKLLSAEVLPAFADALNEMLPNVDTDNIETSLNRLKNAFQEFTQNTGIQNAYKSLIDGLTSFVNYAKDKISTLVTFIISLVSGKLLANVISYFVKSHSILNDSVKKNEVAQAQKQLATEKRIEAQKLHEATLTAYETKENGKRLASKAQVNKAKRALDSAELAERKATLAAQTAAENAAAIKSMGFWKKTAAVIVSSAKRTGIALKAAFSATWVTALLTIISAVVAKMIEMYTEAKRIRNIFSDYQKEESQNKSVIDINQIKVLQSIVNDIGGDLEKRKSTLNELNSLLGTSFTINEKTLKVNGDINKAVEKRIGLLKAAAKAQFYTARQVETEDAMEGIYAKYGGKRGYEQAVLNDFEKQGSLVKHFQYGKGSSLYTTQYKTPTSLQNDINEINQYKKVLGDISDKIKDVVADSISAAPVTPVDDDKKKKSPLQKEEEKYAESVKELTNKLANRAISEEEYKKQLNELNKATYDTLSGMLTPEQAAKNKTYQTVKDFSISSEFSEVQKKHDEDLNKYSNQLKNGSLTEQKYQKAKLDLLQSTIQAIASLDNLSEAEKTVLSGMISEAQNIQSSMVKRPEIKTRDTTFDYKKSTTDILSEELSIAKENLENIKTAYNDGAKDLVDELNYAMANVDNLEDALKIAEVKKDVKDLSKQLNEGIYSGVKEIASSSDRLVSAFSSLKDVFDDKDATDWERIMAVWNAMINTVDAFMSIIKTIEELTKITEQLSKAKQREAVIDSVVTTQKVTNAGIQATAETTTAATTVAAAKTEVAANTAVAGTAAVKSVAGIPIVGIAMAGAALAAIIAMISSLPKFANGGIIGGTSRTGDKILGRFNAGEMVLTTGQQATLFNLANGKGIRTSGLNGKVEFEIRYDKLVGVLKNGDQKVRRGR